MDAPEMVVWSEEDGLEAAGAWTPCDGPVEYFRCDKVAAERLFAEQKPLRMLSDLYCRFAKAARAKDEVTMRRIDTMIEDFRWAWPDAARQHDELYSRDS